MKMKKLTWYHSMGFYNNPFSIKPSAFSNEVIGYSQLTKGLKSKVANGEVIFIFGEYGTGKTTFLNDVLSDYKGKKQAIYYNCDIGDRSIDYDKLLIGAGGFLGRLFRIRKKNMIILLDEAHYLNNKDMEQLKNYYDNGFFKSIIFVSTQKNPKLTKELDSLIGKNRFSLEGIGKAEAVELVRQRIGKLKFISDQSISQIFSKDRNIRAFLKNCEDVCRHAFEHGADFVSEEHIEEVLG